jgi:preprotein translocase subunit YajC
MPALMPFLMGVLMMGVFFLVFNVHKQLRKRRIDETSATLLLGALSVVMGGLLWVASDLILGFIRSML